MPSVMICPDGDLAFAAVAISNPIAKTKVKLFMIFRFFDYGSLFGCKVSCIYE